MFLLSFRPCFPVYMQEILSTRDSPLCHTREKSAKNIHFESFSHAGIFLIISNRWGIFWYFHFWEERSLNFIFFLFWSWVVYIFWSLHVLSEIASVCSILWNLLSTLDLIIHDASNASGSTTQLLPSLSELKCPFPKISAFTL